MKTVKSKKTKQKKNAVTRHIPKAISDLVRKRDFFRCVWCGTHIQERHHIEEYHLGGKHTVDNLVVLCPNCHTRVHRGEIKNEELRKRMNNQIKGDRINGTALPGVEEEPVFKLGTSSFFKTKTLVAFNYQSILSYKLAEAGDLLISYKIYDKNGNLIFWMSDNSYWTTKDFTVTSNEGIFEIKSKINDQFLKITKINDNTVEVLGQNYFNGYPIILTESGESIGSNSFSGNICVEAPIGINFSSEDSEKTGPKIIKLWEK